MDNVPFDSNKAVHRMVDILMDNFSMATIQDTIKNDQLNFARVEFEFNAIPHTVTIEFCNEVKEGYRKYSFNMQNVLEPMDRFAHRIMITQKSFEDVLESDFEDWFFSNVHGVYNEI